MRLCIPMHVIFVKVPNGVSEHEPMMKYLLERYSKDAIQHANQE